MIAERKYWKIECSQHTKILFSAKVETSSISEKKLKELIDLLMVKYALSDSEILEKCMSVPFKRTNRYVQIERYQEAIYNELRIVFSSQICDIAVTACLSH